MGGQELATAMQYDLPLVVILVSAIRGGTAS